MVKRHLDALRKRYARAWGEQFVHRDPKRVAVYFTKRGSFASKGYQHRVPEAWQAPLPGSGVPSGRLDAMKPMVGGESRERPRVLAGAPLGLQVRALEQAVRQNPVARTILRRAPQLRLPSWYLGAGGVTQSVWNHLHGFEPTHGVDDYDLVYFDSDDLSAASERATESRESSSTPTWTPSWT